MFFGAPPAFEWVKGGDEGFSRLYGRLSAPLPPSAIRATAHRYRLLRHPTSDRGRQAIRYLLSRCRIAKLLIAEVWWRCYG